MDTFVLLNNWNIFDLCQTVTKDMKLKADKSCIY